MPVVALNIATREPYHYQPEAGRGGGQLERLMGELTFEVEPGHPSNAGIVDLELAPLTESGKVRFTSDFSLICPVGPPPTRVLVDVTNRGRPGWGRFNHTGLLFGQPAGGGTVDGPWAMLELGWQHDVYRGGALSSTDSPLRRSSP